MTVEEAYSSLRGCMDAGRLAHAYLLVADSTDELRPLVRRVLSALFCSAADKPCGRCRACATVEHGTHPDVLWIEPQSKARKITVDEVRALRRLVFESSFLGGWKSVVLPDADRLTESAANAFLKALEEPPPRTVFFLLTSAPQALLPTVISRCHRLQVAAEDEAIDRATRDRVLDVIGAADLGTQRASDAAGYIQAERLQELLRALKAQLEAESKANDSALPEPESRETAEARGNARYLRVRSAVMRVLLRWHRDVLALRCGCGKGAVFHADRLDALREQASRTDMRHAVRNVAVVEEAAAQLERALPEAVVLPDAFGRLR
jgi:DNA polymerase-3 subunit delta'